MLIASTHYPVRVKVSMKRNFVQLFFYPCSALWKHHVNLLSQFICDNKFTWCFHKAKQVYCIHHANVQET